MSTNCLVTKLKGTVNADLERFGLLRIHFAEGNVVTSSTDRSQFSFYCTGDDPVTLIMDNITGGCHFTSNDGTEDRGTEVSVSKSSYGNFNCYISKGSCDIFIPKDRLSGFNTISTNHKCYDRIGLNIGDMKYYQNFGVNNIDFANLSTYNADANHALKGITGNISSITGEGITSLSIAGTGIEGNLTAFLTRNIETLTSIEAFDNDCALDVSLLNSLDVSGFTLLRLPNNLENADFAYLGNLSGNISLQSMKAGGKFTGTIESFAQKKASKYGAGSNTISQLYNFANVTYQGTPLSQLSLGTSTTFSWDAEGNITSFE
jgi:hypothetical protein